MPGRAGGESNIVPGARMPNGRRHCQATCRRCYAGVSLRAMCLLYISYVRVFFLVFKKSAAPPCALKQKDRRNLKKWVATVYTYILMCMYVIHVYIYWLSSDTFFLGPVHLCNVVLLNTPSGTCVSPGAHVDTNRQLFSLPRCPFLRKGQCHKFLGVFVFVCFLFCLHWAPRMLSHHFAQPN